MNDSAVRGPRNWDSGLFVWLLRCDREWSAYVESFRAHEPHKVEGHQA